MPSLSLQDKDARRMRKKGYDLKLKLKERQQLADIVKKGSEKARKITRCRILLLSEQEPTQQRVAERLDVTYHTVRNVCRQYTCCEITEAVQAAAFSLPVKLVAAAGSTAH